MAQPCGLQKFVSDLLLHRSDLLLHQKRPFVTRLKFKKDVFTVLKTAFVTQKRPKKYKKGRKATFCYTS